MKDQVATKPSVVDAPPAPLESSMTIIGDRIEFVLPIIHLQAHEFIDFKDTRTQVNKWEPSRATVINGMVVIEEWGIAIPNSSVKTIRVQKKAPTS